MSSPTVMQRLGSTASKYVQGLKALPVHEDEIQGLRANAQNVADASKPPATLPARVGGAEMLHPHAKYGDKPGEKRLDSEGNVIPAYDCGGDVKVMSPMMYDEGGDVGIEAGRKASAQGDATVQSLLDSPDEVTAPVNQGTAAPMDFSGMAKLGQGIADMKRPADNATAPQYMQPTNAQLYPNAPTAPQNAVVPGYDTGGDVSIDGALPTYDKGGPVDVNDGQHQLAIQGKLQAIGAKDLRVNGRRNLLAGNIHDRDRAVLRVGGP